MASTSGSKVERRTRAPKSNWTAQGIRTSLRRFGSQLTAERIMESLASFRRYYDVAAANSKRHARDAQNARQSLAARERAHAKKEKEWQEIRARELLAKDQLIEELRQSIREIAAQRDTYKADAAALRYRIYSRGE